MSDDQKPIEMPDSLAEAERFKRLFIDPAVTAMGEKMEAHLAPVLSGQRKLFAQMTEQTKRDEGQDKRLDELEKKQTKALVGWGVFATGLSVALSASWGWISKKLGFTSIVLLTVMTAACMAAGPATRPVGETRGPAVEMKTLDPSLEQFATGWQREIGRRFTGAVGVLVHGGDFVAGQWIAGTGRYESGEHVETILEVIDRFHARYPDRIIVLLACNTGHVEIHDRPWLYYSHSSVWCVPDRDMPTTEGAGYLTNGSFVEFEFGKTRSDVLPDVVGNVFEFVNGG